MSARVSYVDGLRAVAVLAVVAYHSAILHPHLQRGGAVNFILGQGSHGVELFFVLSGFCLSYPALARLHEGTGSFDLARYASHRAIRILPPYYIALLLFALLFAAAHVHTDRLAADNVARQILFLDRGTSFVNPSFWTLPIELRWYFIMPAALWLFVRSPKAFWVLAALLAAAQQTRAASTDLYALPAFLFGIAAAGAYVRPGTAVRLALPVFAAAAAAAMLVSPTRELYGSIQIAWEAAAALFVVAAGRCAPLQRLLSLRLLTFVGTASYSIYLIHEPVMEALQNGGVPAPASACAGVAAGCAFWLLAERPFVASPLREALLARVQPAMVRVLQELGIGTALPLVPSSVHAREVQRPPVVSREARIGATAPVAVTE